jgi:hypothetical protein
MVRQTADGFFFGIATTSITRVHGYLVIISANRYQHPYRIRIPVRDVSWCNGYEKRRGSFRVQSVLLMMAFATRYPTPPQMRTPRIADA